MTTHQVRAFVALGAVLVGFTAFSTSPSLQAQRSGLRLSDLPPLDELRALAKQGDAEAQHILGVRYQFGLDVPPDYAEAVRWFRRAAEQGDADAQSNLAFMYQQGAGVPQDDAEAVLWNRRAAEQGQVHAQVSLGLLYSSGRYANLVEAARWFRRAAEQGHDVGQSFLAFLYEDGRGVRQDYVEKPTCGTP